MPKNTPEVYPFGHLHIALFPPGGLGAAWGVYANYDEKGFTRNPPVFSGIIDRKTSDQLKRIAAAISLETRDEMIGGS